MGGGQKALLEMGGRALLARVIARLEPQVDAIAISANGDVAGYAPYGRVVLPDTVADFPGPLAGILAGMRWADSLGHTHIVSVAGDTPFFPGDLVARLERAGGQIALAASPDPKKGIMRQPTFGFWPVSLADNLEDALNSGMRKIVTWVDAQDGAIATFDGYPFDPFFNVNTPADMLEAERIETEHGL